MKTLNEISHQARRHANEQARHDTAMKLRQQAEFRLAIINGLRVLVVTSALIIAVGCVYHGGIGWLL